MVDVANLNIQVDTTDLKDAKTDMDAFTASGGRAEDQVQRTNNTTKRTGIGAGKVIKANTMHSANLMAQWNDIGVMMASGQSPFMLAIQQGTQVNQVLNQMGGRKQILAGLASSFSSMISPVSLVTFGLIGGTAALGQWAMQALVSGKDTNNLSDAMDSLSDAMEAVDGITDTLSLSTDELIQKYGDAALRVREFALAQAEIATAQAERRLAEEIGLLDDVIERYTAMGDEAEIAGYKISNNLALANLQKDLSVTAGQALQLIDAFERFDAADSFQQQQGALEAIIDLLEEQGVALSDVPEELQRAISEMITFSNEADAARNALEGLSNTAAGITIGGGGGGFSGPDAVIAAGQGGLDGVVGTSSFNTGRSGSRGGGGGVDQFATRLERLQQQLLSEREVVDQWYQESQDILADRRAQELLGEEAHKEALLDVEREYQDRLASVQKTQTDQSLTLYGGMFGSMAALAKEGGEKTFKIWKAFSIAQATIDSYRAYTQVLADPFFIGRPWMRAIAAGSVLASGLAQVAAISSASIGGSSGGGGGRSASKSVPSSIASGGDQNVSRNVSIQLTGGETYSRSQVRDLINQINEAVEDGAKIRLV